MSLALTAVTWDGVRELISADARLNVADAFAGKVATSPYFSKWVRWTMPWKLVLAEVEGETVVLVLRPDGQNTRLTWVLLLRENVPLTAQGICHPYSRGLCPQTWDLAHSCQDWM